MGIFQGWYIRYDGDELTGEDPCIYLQSDLWFKIGQAMRKNHCNMFDDNIRYVNNDIPKYFKMGILQNSDNVFEMFELAKYLAPTIRNNEECRNYDWNTRYK